MNGEVNLKTYKLTPYSVWSRRNTPRNFVKDCYHQGSCDSDVENYKHRFEIDKEDLEFFKERLERYGIERNWTYATILAYTLWLMAGDITDEGKCLLGD
jgi:hypothetical protein